MVLTGTMQSKFFIDIQMCVVFAGHIGRSSAEFPFYDGVAWDLSGNGFSTGPPAAGLNIAPASFNLREFSTFCFDAWIVAYCNNLVLI